MQVEGAGPQLHGIWQLLARAGRRVIPLINGSGRNTHSAVEKKAVPTSPSVPDEVMDQLHFEVSDPCRGGRELSSCAGYMIHRNLNEVEHCH